MKVFLNFSSAFVFSDGRSLIPSLILFYRLTFLSYLWPNFYDDSDVGDIVMLVTL